jgi:hypothetical protein
MMPVVKVKGGYKAHAGSKKIHRTRRAAQRQLQAIKANQQMAKGQSYK